MNLSRKAIVVSSIALMGIGFGAAEAIPAKPHPCSTTSHHVGTRVMLPDGSRGHVADLSPAGKAVGYIAVHDDGGWIDFIRECDVSPILTADEATIDEDPL